MSNQVLSSWKVMRRHSSSRNLRLLGMGSVKDSSCRQICLRGGLNSCLEVVTFQRRGSRYMEPSIEPFGEDAALDVLVCDCS